MAKPSLKTPQIRLRVVGVFYDQKLDWLKPGSIKDLLDLAVVQAGVTGPLTNFSYTSKAIVKLVAGKPALCNSLFGFAHNLTNQIKPSLGNKQRAAGYYKLFESTSVEKDSVTVHAWQYYVIRGENVKSNYWEGAVNKPDVSPAVPKATEGTPGFTPFDEFKLVAGDEVIWRNVSIVRNPQTPPIY